MSDKTDKPDPGIEVHDGAGRGDTYWNERDNNYRTGDATTTKAGQEQMQKTQQFVETILGPYLESPDRDDAIYDEMEHRLRTILEAEGGPMQPIVEWAKMADFSSGSSDGLEDALDESCIRGAKLQYELIQSMERCIKYKAERQATINTLRGILCGNDFGRSRGCGCADNNGEPMGECFYCEVKAVIQTMEEE